MLKDAVKIASNYMKGNFALTWPRFLNVLAAYDKGRDERVRQIATEEAIARFALHESVSHDSLPKFDLEGATAILTEHGCNTIIANAFRAYHNGPESTPAPDRPLEVGDKVSHNMFAWGLVVDPDADADTCIVAANRGGKVWDFHYCERSRLTRLEEE